MVLLPAFVVLSYFLDCFSTAEREISREREAGVVVIVSALALIVRNPIPGSLAQ